MYDAATVTAVATDGSHYCEFCGEAIQEGEHFRFSAVMDDGDFYTQHLCQVCGRMWDEASREADGEPVTGRDVYKHLSAEYCADCTSHCPTQMMRKSRCHDIRVHYGEAEDKVKNYGYWYGRESGEGSSGVYDGFATREEAKSSATSDADDHPGETCFTALMVPPEEWLDPEGVGESMEHALRNIVYAEVDEEYDPVDWLSDDEHKLLGKMVIEFFASHGKFTASAAMPFDIEKLDS